MNASPPGQHDYTHDTDLNNCHVFNLVKMLRMMYFAPEHLQWKGIPTCTLPEFFMAVKAANPDLFNQIIQCPNAKGLKC